MNIPNKSEALAPDLPPPDYKFHRGFAIGGFILGLSFTGPMLAIIYATAIIAPGLGREAPSALAELVMLVGLVIAVVLQFTLGYLFGKIGGQGAGAKRQSETLGLEPLESLWYGTRGRINRRAFLASELVVLALSLYGLIAAIIILSGTVSNETGGWIIVLIIIVGAGFNISPIVRRLHDRGFSGWFAVIEFIPLVGQVFWIALIVVPGNSHPNKYGPQPQIIGVASTPLR